MTNASWQSNWARTQQRFTDWWKGEGLVLRLSGIQADPPHEVCTAKQRGDDVPQWYSDVDARAQRSHHDLAQQAFLAESLPISYTDIGPGSLALALGATPGFSRETVWFDPCWKNVADPESLPPITFNPDATWWQVHEAQIRATRELAAGKYLVGLPDLVENIDVVASIRDAQTLMMDMIERPEWVEQRVSEINDAFFTGYDRLYNLAKADDGSSCFGAFNLWGRGKVAKVQCDASAMFSPAMFEQFVAPALAAQCRFLDQSMFHLDGTQCIDKLEILLAIEDLDAIEWTPQTGIEAGGHPRWYDMYRQILAAGKSVQAIDVKPDQVIPLLDAVGPKGMYICTSAGSYDEAQTLIEKVEAYR